MLTSTQNFFIRCLSDFLTGRETEAVASGLNWEDLFSIAKRQSLEGVIYYQCFAWMPLETKKKYMKQYLGAVSVSVTKKESIEELIRIIEPLMIPVIFMKGAVIRGYYPLPPLRSMGDIDVIIHPEDRKRIDEILQKNLGYFCFVDNHAVWTYSRNNLYLEVHDHMFYDNLANQIDYRMYFDQIWENCRKGSVFGLNSDYLFVPDEDFHFLYMMTHAAKHVINNGIGFRVYLDMALMIRLANDRMNWDLIKNELEKLKLLKFTEICFACCERWFGISMPLGTKLVDEDLVSIITEKTFSDGLFGLDNPDNNLASAAKDIDRTGGNYIVAAIKRGIKRLFPPYEDLQLVSRYSFVDGRPWLLPIVWIYRLGYCVVRKMKTGKDYLTEPFTRKKDVLDRQELMHRMGL